MADGKPPCVLVLQVWTEGGRFRARARPVDQEQALAFGSARALARYLAMLAATAIDTRPTPARRTP